MCCKMWQDHSSGWSLNQNGIIYRFCDLAPATVENVNQWRGQVIPMDVWRRKRHREGCAEWGSLELEV